MDRSVTTRLPKADRLALQGLAMVDSNTVADQLRRAVETYVTRRREDPDLEKKVQTARDRDADLLAGLVDWKDDH